MSMDETEEKKQNIDQLISDIKEEDEESELKRISLKKSKDRDIQRRKTLQTRERQVRRTILVVAVMIALILVILFGVVIPKIADQYRITEEPSVELYGYISTEI